MNLYYLNQGSYVFWVCLFVRLSARVCNYAKINESILVKNTLLVSISVRSQKTISSFRSRLQTYLFRQAYRPPYSPSPGGRLLGLQVC